MRSTSRHRQRPQPQFTLGSALSWLGHRCRNGCATQGHDLGADIWFTPRGRSVRPAPAETLVVVDLADSGDGQDELDERIATIKACAAADGIAIHATTARVDRPDRADPLTGGSPLTTSVSLHAATTSDYEAVSTSPRPVSRRP